MIRINATPKEFDDFWNNEISPIFEEAKHEIELVDLSYETKQHLLDIVDKDVNRLYGKLDDIFDNHWKYFSRSAEKDSDK